MGTLSPNCHRGHRRFSKETGFALHKYLCHFKTELGITVGENAHLPLP